MECHFDEGQPCHFHEGQRGEILTPAEKTSRFKRFLAALEMTGGGGQEGEPFRRDEDPYEKLPMAG